MCCYLQECFEQPSYNHVLLIGGSREYLRHLQAMAGELVQGVRMCELHAVDIKQYTNTKGLHMLSFKRIKCSLNSAHTIFFHVSKVL